MVHKEWTEPGFNTKDARPVKTIRGANNAPQKAADTKPRGRGEPPAPTKEFPFLRQPERGRYGGRSIQFAELASAATGLVLPMASPLTTSSTRRLRWRPSAVSLEATGWVLPKPRAVMVLPATPSSARKSRTESERRSESC